MKSILTNKKTGTVVIFVCFFLLAQTSLWGGTDEITGLWEVKMDFDGRETFADLTISKEPNDSLSAKWGSDELADVNFHNGKLTFTRTVGRGERQFTSSFEGMLKDEKLTGKMTNNWGETNVVCIRPKPICPALGKWRVKIPLGFRDIDAVMTITQNADGKLASQWAEEEGEHVISNVKFQDGKLTFDRHVKLTGPEPNMVFEFDTPLEGTIEGDKMVGMMKNEMGQWNVTGTRIGTALIGKWELTTTSERGTRTQLLKIYPDLSGRYEMFGSFAPLRDLKLEGETVTFSIDMGWGERTFTMEFKGTLQGESLTGQFTSPRGEQAVTGKKIVSKAKTEEAKTKQEK
jgi:hypothetical protein